MSLVDCFTAEHIMGCRNKTKHLNIKQMFFENICFML